jgi:hypothetical protein
MDVFIAHTSEEGGATEGGWTCSDDSDGFLV